MEESEEPIELNEPPIDLDANEQCVLLTWRVESANKALNLSEYSPESHFEWFPFTLFSVDLSRERSNNPTRGFRPDMYSNIPLMQVIL